MRWVKIRERLVPPSWRRVERNTSPRVNARLGASADARLSELAGSGSVEIAHRLRGLEREWDIERSLEANASALILASALLSAVFGRRWIIPGVVVAGFLLQHAIQGWCPPIPVLRRLGFRSQREIGEERTALRILRGDFSRTSDPAEALRQVRAA